LRHGFGWNLKPFAEGLNAQVSVVEGRENAAALPKTQVIKKIPSDSNWLFLLALISTKLKWYS